jgi:hypothetical protein
MTHPTDFNDRMLSLGLARVSEAAAMASAELIGRGDEKAADQAAVNAMREQLNRSTSRASSSSAKANATRRRCSISARRSATATGPRSTSRSIRWKARR